MLRKISHGSDFCFALRRDTAFIEPHFDGTGVKTQPSRDLEIRYSPGAAKAANAFRMQREQLGNFDDVQKLFHDNDLSPFEIWTETHGGPCIRPSFLGFKTGVKRTALRGDLFSD
jgi:hypothetical protein